DGGNPENSILASRGLAQEFQQAGVPIVVASQLPLTFAGSAIMTKVFYQGWMDGKDVREALHDARVALYENPDARHDWVSMVSYVRLPEGYNDYLLDVRLKAELAALETSSRHAAYLLEHNIKDAFQYGQVIERLQQRIKRLHEFLEHHKTEGYKSKKEVTQENAGLLASAYKRLAELFHNRAIDDPERAEHWTKESRSALTEARDAYQKGFAHNTSHHWTGVQYLALDAVLTGKMSNTLAWYACYLAATTERDSPGTDETTRVWALGSIAELSLLARLAEGVQSGDDAATTLRNLC